MQKKSNTYKSVDGFIRPTQRQIQPIFKATPKPLAPTPIARPAPVLQQPVRAASTDTSLLNRNLTGSSYLPGAQQASRKQPRVETGSRKKVVLRSVIGAVSCLFIVGGFLGLKIIGNVDKVFHGNVFSDAHALVSQTKLSGESTGRVNILLAGDSADDPGHDGADLTDSIMLVSIDTVHHTGFLLSIPRDTWVDIPGVGHSKINAANSVTNFSESGYPNGGMGQLEEILNSDFGIPINYYSLIDYSAFRDAVNAVGGISVNIASSDPRGLYDPNTSLKLPNGLDTLTGQTALNLARSRGDGYGSYGFPQADFNRTQDQRLMLSALEQKASTVGVLSNPLKLSSLFNSVGNNVKTDLTLPDAIRFTQITKGMDISKLQSLSLSYGGTNPLLKGYTAPDGEDALAPSAGIDDYSQIQQYYSSLTSVAGAATTSLASEAPSVVILNGSGVNGLASKESTVLNSKGFNVVGVADAKNDYPASMVIDTTVGQKPASKQALQQLFTSNTSFVSSTTGTTEAIEAQAYNADFVIVLGKNWVPAPTSSE